MHFNGLKHSVPGVHPRLSFFGLGYVGLCSAVCFASRGFRVIGVDVEKNRLKEIAHGRPPFFEPKLSWHLRRALKSSCFRVSSDTKLAIQSSDVSFITVGTPSANDGSADLSQVKQVVEAIGRSLSKKEDRHLVVLRSTISPGTLRNVVKPLLESMSHKNTGEGFDLCYNPEFLSQGAAVGQSLNPDRLIIGSFDKRASEALLAIYRRYLNNHLPPVFTTTAEASEMIKYANNTFLAVRISLINELANICSLVPGTDILDVAKGIGMDKRIGSRYLSPGPGFGGSCLPKDLNGLIHLAQEKGYSSPLLNAADSVNSHQPEQVVNMVVDILGHLRGKRIAVLGLSFKQGTDDTRESPAIKIVQHLSEKGASVAVHDPRVLNRGLLPKGVTVAASVEECLQGAECCVLATEWPEYLVMKVADLRKLMKQPALIDSRRLFDAKKMSKYLRFAAIGLSPVKPS